jgi:iron-sulfur cluster assembly protein
MPAFAGMLRNKEVFMNPIKITDEAAKAIKDKVSGKDGAVGLRLTIKSTGCSGHSYQMDYAMAENLAEDDKIDIGGAALYIPKINSWMLFGMEIGFEETKMSSGFTFTNPNETGRCGCGESFSVERPKG